MRHLPFHPCYDYTKVDYNGCIIMLSEESGHSLDIRMANPGAADVSLYTGGAGESQRVREGYRGTITAS